MSKLSEVSTEYVTGRIGVRAIDFANSILNGCADAYWYNAEAEEFGLEPWELIEGVDQMVDRDATECDVWFVSGKCRTVSTSTTIYVTKNHFNQANGERAA